MTNERLRQAIYQAGLDVNGLADQVEVDEKTVYRWLSGRIPHPRLRAKVASAVGREGHELWPELAVEHAYEGDVRGEVAGSWAHADDAGVSDWQALLEDAVEQIELLGYSLIDIVATPGVVDTLAAKASSGCQVRVMISAPDSIWVRATAQQLHQHEEDYIGRSELAREIETARGYLEPLTRDRSIALRQFYSEPGYRILRFDSNMLISPRLHGKHSNQGPVLQLRRHRDGGLFDQFADHLQAIADEAGDTVQSAPDLYPDPRTHPDRYQPMSEAAYQQQLEDARQRYRQRAGHNRPIEEVRAEIRRPGPPPQHPAPAD